MMQVHTVGDSHSTSVHGSFPDWVQQNHLGPKTCYSFGIASPRYILKIQIQVTLLYFALEKLIVDVMCIELLQKLKHTNIL